MPKYDNVNDAIKALQENSIKELDLSGARLEDKDIAKLAEALKTNESVTTIRLNNNKKITPEGFEVLLGALSPNVTNLDLSQNNIDDRVAIVLGKALPNLNITRLVLSDTKIGPEGARDLARAMPYSKLTDLILDDNNLGEGIIDIANALSDSKTLTYLSLSNTKIRSFEPELTKILLDGVSKSNLTDLDLSYNDLGDERAEIVAKGFSNSKLTSVYLQDNGIGNAGAEKLIEALQSSESKVKFLNVSRNEIAGNPIEKKINDLQLVPLEEKFKELTDNTVNGFKDVNKSLAALNTSLLEFEEHAHLSDNLRATTEYHLNHFIDITLTEDTLGSQNLKERKEGAKELINAFEKFSENNNGKIAPELKFFMQEVKNDFNTRYPGELEPALLSPEDINKIKEIGATIRKHSTGGSSSELGSNSKVPNKGNKIQTGRRV